MHGIRHFTVARATIAAAIIAFGTLSCSDDRLRSQCSSIVDAASSPAPGALTLTGTFYDDESIIVRDQATNTQVASGTPASARSSFTFTGIASGTHTYEIIASCDEGQVTIATKTVTIQ